MFCVMYEFEVMAEYENEFRNIWRQITLDVKENSISQGSRLHQDIDNPNRYLAYAQWPTQSAWEEFAPLNADIHAELTDRMREICSNISILYKLEVVDNLLLS
jgi:uncharacterized protein YjaG (DUF416 family)